ncbi:MAG: YidC/Oxa1 family membrane protein insertase [Patescibacteria group bacterium]|nr:YidC/Oxa1 family membrane protein insertase [Patescibacteria group bacterium]
MTEIWNFIHNQLLNLLLFLYNVLFQNLGLAVIALTVIIRTLLIPLTVPTLRGAKKMQELKPKLDELKRRHKDDKRRLQEEQMKLYKEHGVNPAAGCLPNIVQIVVLIALYQVFISTFGQAHLNVQFLWLKMTKPDPFFILPISAGVTQLLLSKMMAPAIEKHPEETPKKEESMEDMVYTMQSQMLYLMPLMTIVIGWQLPSGLVLYWFVTTLFSLVQQYFVSGLGGLKEWLKLIKR